jgi:LysR family nitrogen assimilation transcriptional regulator
MLNLQQLAYFVQIAEAGSLTKAAISLDISHSVLSRRIQKFEMELGQRLFQRTGRGVVLTEFGRKLLPRAEQLIRDASRFTDDASTLRGQPSGIVVIGLPGSVAALIAGSLFQTIRSQYPLIRIRLVEGLSGVIEELLMLGRIDIGLYYSGKANHRRGDVPLAVTDLCLVGPPGDALTAGKSVTLVRVAACPLVLPSHPHALRVMVNEACSRAGLQASVPFEVDSLSTMKEAVESRVGYTVCAFDAVARDVAAGRLQAARITNPPLTRLLVMTPAAKHSLTIAARAVANTIQAMILTLVKEKKWRARLP